MKKYIALALVFISLAGMNTVNAQWENITHEGEIGVSLGASHYFGDLNTRARLNRPKLAVGAFFRKQFGNYTGVRVGAHFTQLGYSDIYNTDNEFQKRRNLSFNTNLFELAVQGDFNFFKFVPGDPYHSWTPYITLGLGIFSYDPYAFLNGKKVLLRPLGTEGQGDSAYPDRKPYNTMGFCIPFGVGIKYAINDRMNIGLEITHRFTTTDYVDDVSKTYIGIDRFPGIRQPDGTIAPSIAGLMQDRSYETGTPIGIAGRQRGYPKQKDQYVIAEITFSMNLTSYRCPTAD